MTFEDHDAGRDSEGHTVDSLSMANFAKVKRLSKGVAGTGNLLIHGDNLEALTQLNGTFSGRIRSVYLDPPYDNGESYQHYFDSMGHEEWLISVTARLRAIKPLLAKNGSVWISIDDSELHYLKVAADEVFGRANFIGTVVWERRTTRENRKVFSRNHEYILSYAKDINAWAAFRNSMPITLDIENRYKNPDNDPRGGWQSVSANVQDGHATPQQFYSIAAPNGRVHEAPKGRCWIYTKPKMLQEIEKGNIWFGKDGNGVPRVKKFLKERVEGVTPETLWRAQDVGTTTDAKKHLIQLFNTKTLFDTPKPEQLIQRILHISSDPGDIVLDAYLGSGTTAAVAHKMGRTYIGLENGNHLETHCVHRLQQVIRGEPGGISSTMDWKGGGGFDFYRVIKNESTRAKR
jgi:adenine-specific DNA-methyltransferase